MNTRQLNRISDLTPLADLLPLTVGGEWRMTTGVDNVVTPSTVGFKPQSYFGASKLPAQVIGRTAVFVQQQGQLVRDLTYTFQLDGYDGGDLTSLADHLVENHTLIDVAHSKSPYSVIWYIREDGVMLGLTYMRDQQVVGWHRHDTDGIYESVCCIPETTQVATYVAVQRTINGQLVRYIEKIASRLNTDIVDAFFVDAGLTYDGRNAAATTIRINDSIGYTQDTTHTITSSAPIFTGTATDVGDMLYAYVNVPTTVSGITTTVQQFVWLTWVACW